MEIKKIDLKELSTEELTSFNGGTIIAPSIINVIINSLYGHFFWMGY